MDLGKIEEVLRDLREGKSVEIPVYDFISHSRCPLLLSLRVFLSYLMVLSCCDGAHECVCVCVCGLCL